MSTPVENEKNFAIEGDDLAAFEAIVARYPTKRSAVMPSLWLIQDRDGYVCDGAVTWLSGRLEMSEAKIREVLSFYFMYRETPQAKYVLQVCHNISCHIMGVRPLLTHMEKKLGVRMGETTADGMFALEGVECLGACGMGPCMQVGRHLYEHLTPAKADDILESMRKDDPLRPDTDRELEA